MNANPATIAILAALTMAITSGGVMLIRSTGPLTTYRPDVDDGTTSIERAIRALGRPFLVILGTRYGKAYVRVIGRWIAAAGQSAQTTEAAFAEQHFGLIVIGLAAQIWFVFTGLIQFGLIVLLFTVVTSPFRVWRDARLRQSEIERDMPPFLELMSVLLASGLTFRHALSRVAARLDGALAEEMRLLLNQLEYGYTPRDALDDLLRRSPAPTVKRVVASVRQNDELGVPIAETLSSMAEDVRVEAVVNLKIRAQNAADRAAVVLVFLAIPGALGISVTVIISQALDNFAQLRG